MWQTNSATDCEIKSHYSNSHSSLVFIKMSRRVIHCFSVTPTSITHFKLPRDFWWYTWPWSYRPVSWQCTSSFMPYLPSHFFTLTLLFHVNFINWILTFSLISFASTGSPRHVLLYNIMHIVNHWLRTLDNHSHISHDFVNPFPTQWPTLLTLSHFHHSTDSSTYCLLPPHLLSLTSIHI